MILLISCLKTIKMILRIFIFGLKFTQDCSKKFSGQTEVAANIS